MVRTVRVASNVINTLLPLQPGLSLQQNTFLGDNPAWTVLVYVGYKVLIIREKVGFLLYEHTKVGQSLCPVGAPEFVSAPSCVHLCKDSVCCRVFRGSPPLLPSTLPLGSARRVCPVKAI